MEFKTKKERMADFGKEKFEMYGHVNELMDNQDEDKEADIINAIFKKATEIGYTYNYTFELVSATIQHRDEQAFAKVLKKWAGGATC